jgi:hypothetical protein
MQFLSLVWGRETQRGKRKIDLKKKNVVSNKRDSIQEN